ncbi:DUF6188 family protein [Streptomyces sp. NPDC047976]|uniref:DUF6188 family protein n=1 Tax=Streptomyces sp. NPDC047976 TaxID=3155746 RepID=UPI003413F1AA
MDEVHGRRRRPLRDCVTSRFEDVAPVRTFRWSRGARHFHLTCSPDPSFEAWQVAGPRGWRFASLPGGDLAVWPGSGASES